MPQIIDVPGIGPTSFPDGMTDAQIVSAIQANAPKSTQAAPETSLWSDIKQGAGNLAAGAVRGAGSIGATLLSPVAAGVNALGGNMLTGDERRKQMDEGLQQMGAEPDSAMYQTGKIGGEIAGTAGIGGALAPVAEAANMAKLAAALRAGGFAKDAGMLKNIAGGAISGGTSAAAVNPTMESTGAGAVIGGAIPPVAAGVARVAQPLLARMGNKAAIESIAERSARAEAGNEADRKFAINAMDNAQTYAGATPTAGEAIAGAQVPGGAQGGGILALQRGLHGHEGAVDVLPAALAKQDEALSASLSPFAGGATPQEQAAALKAAKDLRGNVSDVNYGTAYSSDAMRQEMEAAQRLQQGGGIQQAAPAVAPTPGIKSLLGNDAFEAAIDASKKYYGNSEGSVTSLEGLQKIKLAIDDALNKTKTETNLSKFNTSDLLAVKEKLLAEMKQISPMYDVARSNFAANSVPINQLQFNQAIAGKLKNASGDTTGRTFLNAMDSGVNALEKKAGIPRAAGGPSNYLDPANEQALSGIQSHLERQQDMARMLKNIQGDSGVGKIGVGQPVPHVSQEGILSDLLFRSVVGGGENAKRFMAEQLSDPKKFAALLRGLPDNQKLEALRRITQQGAAVSGANVGE